MPNKIAIYPGSFDPISKGHIDIINRALKQFESIIIAIFINLDKTPTFSVQERKDMIQECFKDNPRIKVESFDGLLVDFAKQHQSITIIRGLRAVSDFDYEFQLSLTNRSLDEKIDTVFFMTDLKYAFLSSSIIRQVMKFGGDIKDFVPESVQKHLTRTTEQYG
ncbi:MAG: pantetheine-phosphate adenylyltransferase [bacterium]